MTEPSRPEPRATAAIESPCIDVCVIDPETGYCEGCGRTLDEIAEWSSYTSTVRRQIMAELSDAREVAAASIAPMVRPIMAVYGGAKHHRPGHVCTLWELARGQREASHTPMRSGCRSP